MLSDVEVVVSNVGSSMACPALSDAYQNAEEATATFAPSIDNEDE
jgi:hypothetical protein